MPSKLNDDSSNAKSANPLPDEKVCFNCKHMMWLVGLGQGLKCGLTKHNIENRRHTCDKFEFKQA
jgi:hypothetical protein